ncbi:hypothetical protein C8J56DRAFT_786124, partial [Mycena floridula]
VPPPQKRRKLDIPARDSHKLKQEQRDQLNITGLKDIERLIASKKEIFHAGRNSLQAYRARAIQSCLHMVVNNSHRLIDALDRAAESQGFAASWGGRMVRKWVRQWLNLRELPMSDRGSHKKYFLLLDDPEICTELQSYLRSNKWSMDPAKLLEFTRKEMVLKQAKAYLQHIVNEEMLKGLKRYMELDLFPRIQLKVGKGISLHTAYANDGKTASWIFQGEQPLKKKGVSRGLHRSDVICSTKGWLPDAGQQLEYAKNYDGYWTGEFFVKQLCEKIIPAFEAAHGPEYQALIMVDNSQGHSAYSEDSLLTSRMNMNPGGKQAIMRDGWYMSGGQKVIHPMVYPPGHAKAGLPKGMKAYLRDNCDYTYPTLQENMPKALASVSIQTIRKWELRMRCWMEAYEGGLDAKDAQKKVWEFSSKHYTSHRRVRETLACQMDV